MQKNKRERNKRTLSWSRLDNAAKIFPPTSHGADSGVFRLSCELTESVEPDLLQRALDETLRYYPHMCMVMRRGIFWYYLEQTTLSPRVAPEHQPPCTPLYFGSKSLLFEVTYWRSKVNVDVFHVLADGAGAIAFFTALMTAYLTLLHPEAGPIAAPQPPLSHKREDSFQKYYQARSKGKAGGVRRAHRLRGAKRPDVGLTILEGVADVRQLLDLAHQYNTTLTVYMAALMFLAIHDEMYVRDEKRLVVLTVPVDLRGFFPSDSARNFFSTIRVSYDFRQRSGTLEDIIEQTAAAFKRELTPERLAARMNKMASLEHHPLLRPIPLALKNLVLRISGSLSDLGETVALSNVGKFRLPEKLHPFVRGFGVFMSTGATQLCTCTFGSSLHFGFTSVFESPDIQRNFFTRLSAAGVDLEIRSNEFHKEDAPCSDAPIAT